MKQKGWLLLCAAVLAVCVVVLYLGRDPAVSAGTAPVTGSGVSIGSTDDLQRESLYKLAKVWGFVKYRHPDTVAGNLDWDEALFAVMPGLLAAQDSDQANAVLAGWLDGYPFTVQTDESAEALLTLQQTFGEPAPDQGWISQRDFLGEDVCRYLEQLNRTRLGNRTAGYAVFSDQGVEVDFSRERQWLFKPEDDGMRLLALFRFWNAFAYYSPNLAITPVDWDQALREGIDEMLAAHTRTDYLKALGSLASKTGDGHVAMSDNTMGLYRYYGSYFLPCSFLVIDGQVVVQAVDQLEHVLQAGDILLTIDGMSVEDRVRELSGYFALPEPDKFGTLLAGPLMSAQGPAAQVTVLRNGQPTELTVYTRSQVFTAENPWKTGLLEDGRVGYIDPSTLKEGDLQLLMEDFAHTRGLIVDLRQYPSVFLPYLLGEYLTPEPVQFARLTLPNPALPGSFYHLDSFYTGAGTMRATGQSSREDYPLYQGKVVLLMNENSVSQSEFTLMALRQSPRAVVLGSPSLGADGNVVTLELPGNVQTRFSGLGVYTPEGGATQRVGLEPDVVCLPTVAGLREGRDELMEEAIRLILQP